MAAGAQLTRDLGLLASQRLLVLRQGFIQHLQWRGAAPAAEGSSRGVGLAMCGSWGGGRWGACVWRLPPVHLGLPPRLIRGRPVGSGRGRQFEKNMPVVGSDTPDFWRLAL